MSQIIPGDTGGGTGGGDGGSLGMGGVLSSARSGPRRKTSTAEKAQEANVPDSGVGTVQVGTQTADRKKKKGRDSILGSTGASEEPNVYRPSIGGA